MNLPMPDISCKYLVHRTDVLSSYILGSELNACFVVLLSVATTFPPKSIFGDYMVLSGATSVNYLSGGRRTDSAINITNIASLRIQDIFINSCKGCQRRIMATIPPSAFSSARIRETQQRDMKLSNIKIREAQKYFKTKLTELNPMKYNSKLMNSIWGLYNRYSPHNVKKINENRTFNAELQQSAANSANKSDAKMCLPAAKLDFVWTMNV